MDLMITKISRVELGDVDHGQPLAWTLLDFTFGSDDLDRLVGALEGALEERHGWYCDLHAGDETIVVFSRRSFRYPRSDAAGRAAAAGYARSRGVPEEQLDWPE
jgi:hypothetical protein